MTPKDPRLDSRYRFWGNRLPDAAHKVFSMADPRTNSDPTKATIRLYGPIDSWGGEWGVSAQEVSQALDALPETVTDIQLRVNSPGGEAFEGMAILNMLRAHGATVTAVVDGIAASAASFLVAGCDRTVMSPGTQLMIHDAWGMAIGNPADMRAAADMLDSISNGIAEVYADASGGTTAKWRSLMGKESWFTAKEAVVARLADEVAVVADESVSTTAGAPVEPESQAPESDSPFDLSIFTYQGRDAAPDPLASIAEVEAETTDVSPDESPDESPDTAPADEAAEVSADESADDGEREAALTRLSALACWPRITG